LPARSIESYDPVFDEHGLPKAVVPEQDIRPWSDALRTLLSDRVVYEQESEASRKAALRVVSNIRAGQMNRFLQSLMRKPAAVTPSETMTGRTSVEMRDVLARLSDEKRALLLQRLRQKARQ
jgi:hypothetical protein